MVSMSNEWFDQEPSAFACVVKKVVGHVLFSKGFLSWRLVKKRLLVGFFLIFMVLDVCGGVYRLEFFLGGGSVLLI